MATHSGRVQVRDLDAPGGTLECRPFEGRPGGIAFVGGGSALAVGSQSGTIVLLDALTGKEKRTMDHPDVGTIHAIVPSPDGKSFVSVGGTEGRAGRVKLWDAETGALVRTFDGHADEVWGAAFHPTNGRLATIGGGKDPTLRIWSPDGEVVKTIVVPPWGGYDVAFSPDGRLVAVSPGVLPQGMLPPDGLIGAMLWDARTYQPLGMTAGHSTAVSGLAFSPDSRRLATCGMDRYVRIWDVSPEARLGEVTARAAITLGPGEGWANRLAFTPDGRRLVAASGVGVGRVDVWDAPASPEQGLRPYDGAGDGPKGSATTLAFGPDDRALVEVVTRFGTFPNLDDGRCEVVVRDTVSWQPISRTPEPPPGTVLSAAPGRDPGSVIVSGGTLIRGTFGCKDLFVASRPSSGEPTVFARRGDGVLSFATDAQATRVAVCGNEIQVFRADTSQRLATFSEPGLKCSGVAIDANGRRLATALPDRRVRVYDVDSRGFTDLEGHKHLPTRMAFDHAGRRLVSSAWSVIPDNYTEVKLWDVAGRKSVDLKFPAGSQIHAAFVGDGRRLLTVNSQPGKSAHVQVWDTSTGALIGTYRHGATLVSAIAVRRDGSLLVTGESGGELRFWDVARLVSR